MIILKIASGIKKPSGLTAVNFLSIKKLSCANIKLEPDVDMAKNKFLRKNKISEENQSSTCFFCDKPGIDLHVVSSLEVDQKVRKCATALQDMNLLSKLSVGDMMALKAKYHAKCLTSIYNQVQDKQVNKEETDQEKHDLAFHRLLSHMKDERGNSSVSPVFKLSTLTRLSLRNLVSLQKTVCTQQD